MQNKLLPKGCGHQVLPMTCIGGDYSRTNTAPVSGATNLYTATYYVINSDYRVYECTPKWYRS